MPVTIDDLTPLLAATAPAGDPRTDQVLHRWHDEAPDAATVAEARLCMEQCLPYDAYGRQWRVTYVGEGNEDCFEVEGVEWA